MHVYTYTYAYAYTYTYTYTYAYKLIPSLVHAPRPEQKSPSLVNPGQAFSHAAPAVKCE
jgi:hypothetical protein